MEGLKKCFEFSQKVFPSMVEAMASILSAIEASKQTNNKKKQKKQKNPKTLTSPLLMVSGQTLNVLSFYFFIYKIVSIIISWDLRRSKGIEVH